MPSSATLPPPPPPPPHRRLKLHQPSLQSVADCLDRACREAFVDASVDIVDCPDLSAEPFGLAGEGICGDATMVHAGGVPYLLPTPQAETRRYDLRQLMAAAGCPDGLLIGAGAASSAHFGKNAEFVANLGPHGNGCRVASVANDADHAGGLANCRLARADFAEIGLLGDALCCRGEAGGSVLRLRVAGWRKAADGSGGHFTELLQRALAKEFSGCPHPVGLGGVFRLAGSPGRMHVMPDFSREPLAGVDAVNRWLHFVDMPGPLVCCGTLLSHDPGAWGLRLEHFHGWCPATEAHGGHYHNDVAPQAAEYLAYFSLGGSLLRVDPPDGVDGLAD